MDVISVLNRLIQIFGARLIVDGIGDPFVPDDGPRQPSWLNFTIRDWKSFEYENFEFSEVLEVGVCSRTDESKYVKGLINGDIRDPQGNHWPRSREAEMRAKFGL